MDTHTPRPTERQCSCFNSQLTVKQHGPEQRYMSASTGLCRRLRVQAVNPAPRTNQVKISDGSRQSSKLAIWLTSYPPKSVGAILPWIGKYLWFLFLLVWPFSAPVYTGFYHPYLMRYWGQFWAARSPKEYSTRPEDFAAEWNARTCRQTRNRQKHHACPSSPAKHTMSKNRRINSSKCLWAPCLLAGSRVLGRDVGGKNLDLYRMSDVYRGAAFTLITLPKSDDSTKVWRSWGERVWTLPEALLSPNLRYKVGFDSDDPLANKAYEHYDEETIIINSYSGRDPLERLERLSPPEGCNLASTQRCSPSKPEEKPQSPPLLHRKASSNKSASHTQRRKIVPNPSETELQALARLSMANDNDRIAERMVSMLPKPDFSTGLLVAGVTQSGALVLDGCRAAAIRWKDFPDLAFQTTFSFRRYLAGAIPFMFWEVLLAGIVAMGFNPSAGAFLIVLSVLLMLATPYLVAYANSGRVLFSEPWLIGVKGVLTAEQAAEHLFGGARSKFPRMSYTPTGSPFAMPGQGAIREGNDSQFAQAVDARYSDHIYYPRRHPLRHPLLLCRVSTPDGLPFHGT
ncbi:hypothetical protein BU15DRAFT_61062 [Melanogaster broomeanus]|nr:hypothetical protein BU15DRAFT_61062 [Melanogaster broomeanus]